MNRRITTVSFGVATCFIFLFCLLPVNAQDKQPVPSAPPANAVQESPEEEGVPAGQVVIEGRGPILTVYETVGGRSPQERARAIEQRIIEIARETAASTTAARLDTHPGWTEIFIGNHIVMAVTDADAEMAGMPRQQLAAQYAENITRAIPTYRQEHSWRMILRGVLETLLATSLLLVVLRVVRRLRIGLRDRIENQIRTSGRMEQKSAWHITVAYAGPIVLALGTILRWMILLGLLETYFTVVLGFFSFTREISLTVTKWVVLQLESLGLAAIDYLPNLLVVAVIALVAYYAFRLLRLLFGEIRKGELRIRGFYPDWADPTEKLIRMLVLILSAIIAFPYLPGAKSPAFQGISIFLGVLLSLGSSSAVANAIAGIILTYMRSFLIGDWVQIGETTGEVIEKNLLVTRVLTPKAEIITIPNATVMSGAVKNYSIEAKKSGVIFHTAVTIGYDAPWRTVHQLLIKAALATQHVRQQPQPFVLQNKLDDFYVCYELNAYTDAPAQMMTIYSDLHQNIQDSFNGAGMEICSPHFSSLRDGNVIAIPRQYVAADYQPPGFRIGRVEASDNSPAASGGNSRRTG